jgi:hypothetical protein
MSLRARRLADARHRAVERRERSDPGSVRAAARRAAARARGVDREDRLSDLATLGLLAVGGLAVSLVAVFFWLLWQVLQ